MTAPVRKRSWRRRFTKCALYGVVIWLTMSFVVVWKLTHRPFPKTVETIPEKWDGVETVRLITSDGQDVGAWFIPGQGDHPVVICLHGNGGSRSSEAHRQQFLKQAGVPLLLVTQRAHGDSTGDSNDFGLSARHDLVAAVDWVKRRLPSRPIVVWGHSLGSATALFAGEILGDSVKGYILESPYRDLLTATRNRTRMSLPPVLDHMAYAGMRTAAVVLLPNATSISPVEYATKLPPSAHVLILSGDKDNHATIPEAEAIHECLGDRCRWVVIPGAAHGRLQSTDPTLFEKEVTQFLEAVK